jgi:hypothetical protein
VKAVEATQALSLQSIDSQSDLDDVGAQLGCGDTVDGLIHECVGSVAQAGSGVCECVRFHAHILPNICSLTRCALNTDKPCPCQVLAMYGDNTRGDALVTHS